MRCEHQHPSRYTFGKGWTMLGCLAERGLRSWWDETGNQHRACPAHHMELLRRNPAFDPPEPSWDLAVETVVFEDFIDHAPDATAETEYATYWSSGSGSAA